MEKSNLGQNLETGCFEGRHIGPQPAEIESMLKFLGVGTLDELIGQTVPKQIRNAKPLDFAFLGEGAANGLSELGLLRELKEIASKNTVAKSFIGAGYYGTFLPPVIQRNILENPGWYTQYTPYQAEIAQGRLEALLNFQTLICEMTALPVANASLLDEGTAAAEAMAMSFALAGKGELKAFWISDKCHPQTKSVVKTRAEPLGISVIEGKVKDAKAVTGCFGYLLQYPDTEGVVEDYSALVQEKKSAGAKIIVAADLLALTLLKPPGEWGADIAIGSAQRFGVPMGYGGPHAAYMATRDEFKRQMPGRLIGVSKDTEGKNGYRLALQTREQHIRRDKATSNICTSQVLLAILASMYAVYHGAEGLTAIARRVNGFANEFNAALKSAGIEVVGQSFFDTITFKVAEGRVAEIQKSLQAKNMLVRWVDSRTVGVSFDELSTQSDLVSLIEVFAPSAKASRSSSVGQVGFGSQARTSRFLTHSVFNKYRSETEMQRYVRRLESRDLSLTHSMISLGSCTMKLNAAAEMLPISWPEFAQLHPFAPLAHAEGYQFLFKRLEALLAEITGFSAISLQPNAGSQGEYAGLLTIRAYHLSRGEKNRDVCLIPQSAHGTNPASAAMAGMKVVVVACDDKGNINVSDLKVKLAEFGKSVSAFMVTYPSTHGVFEESIKEVCELIHSVGAQVYMDGANLNAQVGFCRPGEIGADVCHLNLHKTFAIPHGGGGPGMGPIGVAKHLAPFLPNHAVVSSNTHAQATSAVSAAPWGSASILPISYAYIRMMGAEGLKRATAVAILNANYMAEKLHPHFPVLYRGSFGRVAHECILDFRPIKSATGIEVEDVAKRLMDFGFHAPTVSFPACADDVVEVFHRRT